MNLAKQYIDKHLNSLTKEKQIPNFSAGDTLKIHNLITDGNKQRIQIFEGVCLTKTFFSQIRKNVVVFVDAATNCTTR